MSLFPIGSLVQADTVSGETTGTNANYIDEGSSSFRGNKIFSNYNELVSSNAVDTYYAFVPNWIPSVYYNGSIQSLSLSNTGAANYINSVGGNALALKIYDDNTDSYYYKIVATATKNQILRFASFLYNTMGTVEIQKQLYTYMKNGNMEGIKEIMGKYLPTLYVVTVSDADVSAFNALSKTEAATYFADGTTSTNILSSTAMDTMVDMTIWGNVSFSEKAYTYDNAKVEEGHTWRPMDRTLTGTNGANGTFSMPGYWVTGTGTTAPAGEYAPNSIFSSYTDDLSWTYTDTGTITAITDTFPYATTAITVNNLTTGKNSVIDLSYANTSTGNLDTYTGTYTDENGDIQPVTLSSAKRYLIADSATLAEGTTFRLGAYGTSDYQGNASTDTVYIGTASPADSSASKTNLYIQLGYVPGILSGASYGAGYVSSPGVDAGGIYVLGQLLGIYSGADKFAVTAQTSKADGIYSVYEITPVIGEYDNYFTDSSGNQTGTMWYLKGYTYEDTGEIAESGRTAGDNALTLQNLWKTHVSSLFNRPEDLHRRYTVSDGKTPRLGRDLDEKENVWAEAWHGRYSSTSDYGRHVGQNYTGLQAGYDKLLNGTYGGGKVYAGLFATRLDSDSDTSTGKGDQDGSGLGFYGTWVGSKGHYVDAVVSALRLSDDYHFIGNTGDGTLGNVYGKWSTWTYGMGLQYGKRNDRDNGFWWDPTCRSTWGTWITRAIPCPTGWAWRTKTMTS